MIDKSIMKIVSNEDLSASLSKLSLCAHLIAKEAFPLVWNSAINEFHEISKTVTGNDALSAMSTLLSHFISLFLVNMKSMVDKDDTGYTLDEIQKSVFDLVSEMIQSKKIKKIPSVRNNEFKKIYTE